MSNRRRILAVIATLCLVSACGSTVQNRGLQSGAGAGALSSGNAGGDGLGGPAAGLDQGSGPSSAGGVGNGSGAFAGSGGGAPVGAGSGGSGSGSTSGGTTTTSAQGNSASAPGGASGVRGGTSATEIKLGYVFSSDQASVGNSLGLKGIVAGDTGRQYQAIAKDINGQGGVLGRKIVLVGYDQSTANEYSNPSEEENKACTYFVQDKPVFAVLSAGVYLSPCLAKHGIPSIGLGSYEDNATINSQLLFDGGGMLINVLAKAFVERLVAESYFTGWNTATGASGPAPVKVGLIYQDSPIFKHYYTYIKAAFKQHGITVDPKDEFLYAPTVNGVTSQSQAAVLRFGSDGVTHVFGAALAFFKAADSQQYHPRYALDSIVPPALLAQNIGASQLRGSLGIGWRPTQDVDQAQDPGPVSPQATRCTQIMKAAGEDVSTRTVLYLTHIECEQMWSIAAAFRKGGQVSVNGVINGFGNLGRVVPTLSFGERWALDRRASNTTVADLGYVESCSCFAYTKARTSF